MTVASLGPARRRGRATLVTLTLLLVVAVIAALGTGRYGIPFFRVVTILLAPVLAPDVPVTPMEATVVFTVRLPRILLALLSGAGLALSGRRFRACSATRWSGRRSSACPQARPSAVCWRSC